MDTRLSLPAYQESKTGTGGGWMETDWIVRPKTNQQPGSRLWLFIRALPEMGIPIRILYGVVSLYMNQQFADPRVVTERTNQGANK